MHGWKKINYFPKERKKKRKKEIGKKVCSN
jgi:hypothetical protein